MPFSKELPTWNKPGTSPPQSLKDNGWEANQKPPADYFNWFFYTVYNALKELQEKGYTKEEIDAFVNTVQANLTSHINDKNNPHSVTKAQVGLGNVDNVKQATKTEFDSHNTDAVRHVTQADKDKWNAAAPANHTHVNATSTTAGFMSNTDKSKLDGIEAGANKYVHPTGDGNLHVPATGTTNDKKVLKAGNTAGSVSWGNVDFSELTGKPTTLSGYGITDAAPSSHVGSGGSAHAAATQTANGFMSASDKTKLDNIAAGAEVNQNAFTSIKVGTTTVDADSKTDTLELVAGSNVSITPDATNDKVTIAATVPVSSVNGKTGSVVLSASDVGAETPSGAQAKADQAEADAINWTKSYGLGDVAKDISNTDLNNLDVTGFYRGGTLANSPDGTVSTFYVINIKYSSTYKLQIATRTATVGDRTYQRINDNGTWTSWVQLETTVGAQAKANQAETNAKNASVPLSGNVTKTGMLTLPDGINFNRQQNFKSASDLPSAFPTGVTMFFVNDSSNILGFPRQYGTVVVFKGYNNMACTMFFYPYNNNDKIKYRHALYNSDVWLSWETIETDAGAQAKADTAEANAKNASVPRSGGTMTGELNFADDGEGVTFFGGARVYKKVGTGLVLRRHSNNTDPQVESNDGTSLWKIWHAGNGGSGSGLDADKVDGKHFTDIQADSQAKADTAETNAKNYANTLKNDLEILSWMGV
ncbi:pyocin knob domain-containing protein [Fictibacillus sp. Mic-4]|uniref:pyocin knob domain-containing protein n=1 Tax=Fictibacillus sp. Mic-4 TaxID=3132826 RepID=UPI003CEC6B1F